MNEEDIKYLKLISKAFREVHRENSEIFGRDFYIEGPKWIKVTDELANEIADRLEKIVEDNI